MTKEQICEELKVPFPQLNYFMAKKGITKTSVDPRINRVIPKSPSPIHDSRKVTLDDIKYMLDLNGK